MTTEHSLDGRVKAFNDKLKTDGIYEERDPWRLPVLYHGSLLDVPATPESRARIECLKRQIAELKREKQKREGVVIKEVTGGVAQEVQSLLLAEMTLEEQPSATDETR